MSRALAHTAPLAIAMTLGFSPWSLVVTLAQESSGITPASVRLLDREAERLQDDYLENLSKLAKSYEAAGDTDRATRTLRKILEIDAQAEGVKAKLDELENRVFDSNSATIELDVAKGWFPTGLHVEKEQPIRLEAQGSYKYIVNASLGPEGFSTQDPKVDMADRVGTGELMGWIIPERESTSTSQRRKQSPPDLGRPFPIGSKTEVKPDKTGQLVLRVNIPPGSTSNGRIRVKVSGHFARP